MENEGVESRSGIQETEEFDGEGESEKGKSEGGVDVVRKIPIAKSEKKTGQKVEELSCNVEGCSRG